LPRAVPFSPSGSRPPAVLMSVWAAETVEFMLGYLLQLCQTPAFCFYSFLQAHPEEGPWGVS
jgi:hypothetical protein